MSENASIRCARLIAFLPVKRYNNVVETDKGGKIREFGKNLSQARKKSRLSLEEVAEKLGVSRHTISKWEAGEATPDICQSQKMATLYNTPLDELIEFHIGEKEIQAMIDRTHENVDEKINWTNVWGKKYPILLRYQSEIDTAHYATRLSALLDELKQSYQYSELDAVLVLKDIIYRVWNDRKHRSKK